jgi:1-acyl-sn-glycerol-3-phosphate acyltransferase
MTIGLRFFYRRIHVTGLENIPASGPAIIIANHASSLMDAALLGILFKRPAYFFARGDVFVNKPVRIILSWLHMMPIHNHEAGRHTLTSNNDSLQEGQRILESGGIIVFFPESNSHIERQLLPFRKGVFRLAFKTAMDNQFHFEIPIIPIGISYDHPVDAGAEVMVHATKAILLSSYMQAYLSNEAATLLQISKDAYMLMRNLVLHIDNKKRLQTAEYCLIIDRNNHPAYGMRWKIKNIEKLEREKAICTRINHMSEPGFETIKQQSNAYFAALNECKIKDQSLLATFRKPITSKFLLWLGYPIYIMGMLLNAIPVLIARRIADKKVYRSDFYSWIFVGCYSCLYFLWAIILLSLICIFFFPVCIVLMFLLFGTGIAAFIYSDCLQNALQRKRLTQLGAEKLRSLSSLRNNLR